MTRLAEITSTWLVGIAWLAGIVLANGAISTTVAICFPPYAWYLVIEKSMILAGLVQSG
jgi:hypothetical protein